MAVLWEEQLESLDTTEVHWSTGTILAVFFAASLVVAVFFGLGYSFGRGGTQKSGLGRSSLEPLSHSASADQPVKHLSSKTAPHVSTMSTVTDGNRTAQQTPATFRQAPVARTDQATVVPAERSKPTPSAAHANNAVPDTGTAHYMVQVGAIGNHKDARRLVVQLRKHGFHAGIYSGKHDKYLHVQIGPFADAKQAKAMQHKVLDKGYHAMLKPAP